MRFNQPSTTEALAENHPNATTNYEGGLAYSLSPKLELYQRVATWLVNEPKFYGATIDELPRVVDLINQVADTDPEFVLKLAYHCRTTLMLRTAPIVMLVEASLIQKCKPYVRKYTPKIVTRADQITEALAYLKQRIGDLGDAQPKGSVPHALKRGLADAFSNFDTYQLSKYNRDSAFKLKDAIKLVRPKPSTDGRSALYKSIIEGTLEAPNTWEVVISTQGSTTETWSKISKDMPYMALLRNLRNFLQKNVDMTQILEKISNKEAVKKSRQLPFRYVSAYNAVKMIPNSTATITALDRALLHAGENLPMLDGITAIAADHSGSMDSPLSDKSEITRIQAADTFLAFAHRISKNPITMVYGSTLQTVQFSQLTSMLAIIDQLSTHKMGGTSTFLTVDYLLQNKIKVDRIIILTDEEGYNGSFYERLLQYRSQINPDVYCYMVNVAGYGTSEVPENDSRSMMIAGFSERVLEFVKIFESDKALAVKNIEDIKVD